jgi:hypothetical protein
MLVMKDEIAKKFIAVRRGYHQSRTLQSSFRQRNDR